MLDTRDRQACGRIDRCLQSHIAGWATEGGLPATIRITVNGKVIRGVGCDIYRPDLEAHGIPVNAGFWYQFPEPLGVDDEVSVFPFKDRSAARWITDERTHIVSSPDIARHFIGHAWTRDWRP
jgi:hypothetical protein